MQEIYEYREMILSLVRRDLKGRYKNSLLGFFWTFLNPLLQLMIYTFAFSVVMPMGIENYYMHLFVALIPWIFFSTCMTGGARAIIDQQDMVKKIYFPRQVLPIAFVTSQFVNMLLSFVVVFAVLIVSGIGINIQAIVVLPAVMVIQYLFVLGIALACSAISVYYRDMEQIFGILSIGLMYASPVVYSLNSVPPEFHGILNSNPMTVLIVAYRDILFYKQIPDLKCLFIVLLESLCVVIVGWCIFEKLQRRFVEEF